MKKILTISVIVLIVAGIGFGIWYFHKNYQITKRSDWSKTTQSLSENIDNVAKFKKVNSELMSDKLKLNIDNNACQRELEELENKPDTVYYENTYIPPEKTNTTCNYIGDSLHCRTY